MSKRREWAIAQLRHLYKQMVCGDVKDTKQAAHGLLGPAIAALELDLDVNHGSLTLGLKDNRGPPRRSGPGRSASGRVRGDDMSNTPLMKIVRAAAERFDKRPEYRASVEARAELQSSGTTSQQ